MTKKELVEMLENVPDDADISVALQPSYPMLGHIRNVCIKRDENGSAIGAVFACSGNESYTSDVWWNEDAITVDDNGEPIEE